MAQKTLSLAASSNISGATYDPETLDLVVTFKGGQSYVVSDVSTIEAEGFESASSAGRYYNENFRDSHVVSKV